MPRQTISIRQVGVPASSIPSPAAGEVTLFVNSATGNCSQKDSSGTVKDLTSATASPAGTTTQVQFNDAGTMAGDAGLTFDKTNDILFAPKVNYAVSTLQTPAADSLTIGSVKNATVVPKFINPDGVETLFQTRILGKSPFLYLPATAATGTGTGFGGAVSTSGNVTHPTQTLGSTKSAAIYRTRWANVVTTANQSLGLLPTVALLRYSRQLGFDFHCNFFLDVFAAGARLVSGLANSTVTQVAVDLIPNAFIGLFRDTTDPITGSGALNIMSYDATTRTKTPINITTTLASGQGYEFYMYAPPNGSDVKYKLVFTDTGATIAEGTVSVTLPSNILLLAPHTQMSNGTANTTANAIILAISSYGCMNA